LAADSSLILYALIIGCEVAFWVVLVAALAARYWWRAPRLSRVLLLSLPGIDLLLLAFTALDLRGGATATTAHGLATAYIGFTIAFGGILVAWADERFAHRFAGGPPPPAAPDRGWSAVVYELRLWVRSIVAWAIALVLVVGLIAIVGDRERTKALEEWFQIGLGVIVMWFVFGPLWNLVFFKKEK
jgi:hypothetical protein